MSDPAIFPTRNTSLREALFAPLHALITSAKLTSKRSCPELNDLLFLESGVQRVIHTVSSGRDFIQRLKEIFSVTLKRSNFFAALNSARRLELVREANEQLSRTHLEDLRNTADALASIPELAGREVWAGDGTSIEHACHDQRNDKGVYLPIKHIFSIDLRTRWCRVLSSFTSAAPRRHEIKSLKVNDGARLRMGGKKGIIHVYDRAVIDFGFWRKQKSVHGIYFISRSKINLAPVSRISRPIDQSDPRNAGVLKDERIGIDQQGEFRLVTYQDAESGEIYEFLTSDLTLPPGIIAHLYRLRWTVEKLFDQMKNKFSEKKAWVTSDEGKEIQAQFIALTQNLLLLLSEKLKIEESIVDTKVEQKAEQRHQEREEKVHALGRRLSPLIKQLRVATQFSVQFLRWLCNHLTINASYSESVAALRPLMEAYLEPVPERRMLCW